MSADIKVELEQADAAGMTPHSKNRLDGMTLEAILNRLFAHYGWDKLGKIVAIKCFTSDPSIASSLKFLRKTPWARKKVEDLYQETRFADGACATMASQR